MSTIAGTLRAQQGESPTLPNAPSATASSYSVPPDEMQQQRVMGIVPNFGAVSPGVAVLPASPREKLITATQDNFDYSALVFRGIVAAGSFAGKETPEFGQGAKGYARYYWHSLADQSIENYFVEYLIPVMHHEDARYFAMGREGGSPIQRAWYSVTRTVVTKSDEGKPMFNYSEVVGSAAATSISTFYYPRQQRTASSAALNWGQDVGWDAVNRLFVEFWPDINNALFHPRKTKASKRRWPSSNVPCRSGWPVVPETQPGCTEQ